MRNPKFDSLLKQMEEMHDRKNEDYAADDNPYSNFEEVAEIADISVDKVFMVMIATKIVRLKNLMKGKTPKNESIWDSKLDLAVYSALMASYSKGE